MRYILLALTPFITSFRSSAFLSAIIAGYLALSTLIAAGAADVLHQRSAHSPYVAALTAAASEPVQAKYLVLMVLDGAQPADLDVTGLPQLDALRARGTQFTNAMSGILEAETPAGHATISTGSRPDRSGILGFDWGNDDQRYSLFDPSQMPALLQILQGAQSPTIGALYKQRFPSAKVVALSGHKYYAAAPLGGPTADAIMYFQGDSQGRYVPVAVPGHLPPAGILNNPQLSAKTTTLPPGGEDHLATNLAVQVVKTMHPRLLLMNYPEFDWPVGHIDGGLMDRAAVTTVMRGFDADLGHIEDVYRKAGILNKTLFVITADHGMMPITHYVPASTIQTAVTRAGTTAPDIAASSGDYIWLADGTKAAAVAQNVMQMKDPGIQMAYSLQTVNGRPKYVAADPSALSGAEEAANQYLLGALLNGHKPDVVVFGHEGVSFSDPGFKWKADHGGSSWESQHVPLILAGPGIVPGSVSSEPAQLEDVAPTVLTDMGVKPAGMEGNVLTAALDRPPALRLGARRAEMALIGPVVSSLESQSARAASR